jgi:hypothetical protein
MAAAMTLPARTRINVNDAWREALFASRRSRRTP